MPIYAEARIGELLPSAEEAERGTSTNGERYRRPEGMTNKRARAARTIKDHPEIVAKIKAQAREKLAVSKADAARIMHGAMQNMGLLLSRGRHYKVNRQPLAGRDDPVQQRMIGAGP